MISWQLLERSPPIYDNIYLRGDAGRRRSHLMANAIAFSTHPRSLSETVKKIIKRALL
ncbi:hypothetical protein [Microcoleus sp. B9-D4]|uniref:hypothetical protein n=1 Tax=Microcoleus sp. B9-D4 TaxID=2818711 RepID=UPI002FD74B3E